MEETLIEYPVTYHELNNRLERMDKCIGKLDKQKRYVENVNKLVCFRRIKVHIALSFLVEVGDFKRFP